MGSGSMSTGDGSTTDAGAAADECPVKLPASQIPVARFREILLWPLALRPLEPAADDRKRGVEGVIEDLWRTIGGNWHAVPDPARHLEPNTGGPDPHLPPYWRSDVYAEGQYFHDFVTDFLFPAPGQKEGTEAFRLFRRTDIRFVRATWWDPINEEPVTRTLAVERLNLYVFRTGAGVMVLELSTVVDTEPAAAASSGWTLADVQAFHDVFRRTHIPYAIDGQPRGVVSAIAWLGAGENVLAKWAVDSDQHARDVSAYLPDVGSGQVGSADATTPFRHAPILPHWGYLLDGALNTTWTGSGPVWQHVSDDRMPTMIYVSLTAKEEGLRPDHWYRRVRRGDFMRLAFADSPGDSEYPYDPRAFKTFDKDCALDWFASLGTRYLTGGNTFVAVGAGTEFDGFVATHFRRHYFQMGLLLHFEVVSLLAFSRAITAAAKGYQAALRDSWRHDHRTAERQQADDAAFHAFSERMRRIERDLLQFTHRFHFTGISTQMQARALFDLWKQRLNLPDLFDDLNAELRGASEYLHSEWQRRQSLDAEEQSRAANQIAAVASLGVAIGLPLAFLGMNVLAGSASLLLLPIDALRGAIDLVPLSAALAPDPASGEAPVTWRALRAHGVAVFGVVGVFMMMTGAFTLAFRDIIAGHSLRKRNGLARRLGRMVIVVGGIAFAASAILALVP